MRSALLLATFVGMAACGAGTVDAGRPDLTTCPTTTAPAPRVLNVPPATRSIVPEQKAVPLPLVRCEPRMVPAPQ